MPAISATGEQGFTLLELLVVLAIFVLLISAYPLVAGRLFPVQRLRSEAHQLAEVTNTLRLNARLEGSTSQMILLPRNGGYQTRFETHPLPAGMTIRFAKESQKDLVFFPDGSSSGGLIQLLIGERRLDIRVGSITGKPVLVE